MNRRLAYQGGNLKNLRNKAAQEQTRKLKREDGGARDSEDEMPIDDLEASEEETQGFNSIRTGASQGSIARTDRMMNANDSFNQDMQGSLNGSVEEEEFQKRNFSDMQDDRQIVKIAALNDKYKLVERPRFLSSFDTLTWESKFATSVFRKHFGTEICNLITKGIFDCLLAEAAVYSIYMNDEEHEELHFYILVGIIMVALLTSIIAILFCRQRKKPRCIPL